MNVTRAAVIAAFLATLVPGRGEAAPVACVQGTLSEYFALSDACTVGAFQFRNFAQLTTQPAGSSPMSPDGVQVMPVASGLAFGVDVSARPGELLEILFGYDVTGSGIAGAGLSLSGASAAGDGAVTAVKNFCEGGRFDPGELTGCTGTGDALIAAALDGLEDLNQSLTILPTVALLGIVDDIAIDGGVDGSASLQGSVTNQFVGGANPVPEPASAVLVASGILGLLRSRVRGVRRRIS